ncbi:MAG TPA: IS66 family transposase [Bryobacteraceae bacterium]|jgi:transposase|nr:IS66 family transposase [Bryobacteraceae bacterium]
MKAATERLDVTSEELAALVEAVREALGETGYQKLQAAIRTLGYVTELLETRQATLEKLRRLLCHSSTEKTKTVLQQAGIETGEKKPKAPGAPKSKAPGHGRNGAAAYRGARKVEVPHASLKAGDPCPDCQRGKVYPQRDPGVLVRIKGQAPIAATVYELEKFRCNLCGDVFTAAAPEEAGEEKYDETAASMIALLRYGSGFPWYRLEGLQENLGIPLPTATQCEIVKETAAQIQPAGDELIRQAAQGGVVHNDDTSMRVLALDRGAASDADLAAERTGVFTTGIISIGEGYRIGLYFTGRKHAGENLSDILKQRAAGLAAPIQMCDALSRNLPKLPEKLEIIIGHCLAHARRYFVEVTPNFPQECRFVLESLGEVYGYDEAARAQGMSPEQRLHFHQEHSGPVMEKLHIWLEAQFDERRVEPNSGLGQAISYLLKHWDRLTLFLRQPGAPLDNNICERALKKSILHRKNSLFYKTRNGARIGDLFMSLIHTCELNGADPFDYLNQLQRHAEELKLTPSEWMPWNYRATLARTGALLDAA